MIKYILLIMLSIVFVIMYGIYYTACPIQKIPKITVDNIVDKTKEVIQFKPYNNNIKNETLYTQIKELPLEYITNIEHVKDSSTSYVIIHYQFGKYNFGMLTMNYQDYKKIEQQIIKYTIEKIK